MTQGPHRLVHHLLPAHLDDLGLVPALQYLVHQDAKGNALDVRFDVEGTIRRLDDTKEAHESDALRGELFKRTVAAQESEC